MSKRAASPLPPEDQPPFKKPSPEAERVEETNVANSANQQLKLTPSPMDIEATAVPPVRMNHSSIDLNSFHIVCDYLTLTELATTIGRVSLDWLQLLSSYRPSPDHPFKREMKIPTGEDEDLSPIGYHSEMAKERQIWMQQSNLLDISRAAPVYRRLISTLILESRPHDKDYRHRMTLPSTSLSPTTLQLLGANSFPNLRTLYCNFSPYKLRPASIHPGTGRHRYDWSLPSQLHTLDCTIDSLEPEYEDVDGFFYLAQRIGECRSLRRLSIHFSSSSIILLREMRQILMHSLSKLVDLIELELVCFDHDSLFYDSNGISSFKQLRSFFRSFPCMTALRPWLYPPSFRPELTLLAPPFPIHQLKCTPHIVSPNTKWCFLGNDWIQVRGHDVSESTPNNDRFKGLLRKMSGLTRFVGLISTPTTDLFTSLTRLTDLQVYCLKPNTWNGDLLQALTYCQQITKLTICLASEYESDRRSFRTVPISSSTDPITEFGLGRLFSSLSHLEYLFVQVNYEHEFFIQAMGVKYAPHLRTTLKTLELFCGFPPLIDLQHLTSLTRLRLDSFTATKDEFIQVFNSFHSLTSRDLTPDFVLDDASIKYFACHQQVERLSSLSGVTSLDVRGSEGKIEGDLFVSSLQQAHPPLESLKLSHLPDLRDQHISQIMPLFSTTLKQLEISNASLLTDLSSLSAVSTKLVKLSLINLPLLHPSSMMHIRHLKYLESLTILGSLNLLKSSYQLLATMKRLISLDLDPCIVEAIIKSDPDLDLLQPELNMINFKHNPTYPSCPSRFTTIDFCEICIQRHPFWIPPHPRTGSKDDPYSTLELTV